MWEGGKEEGGEGGGEGGGREVVGIDKMRGVLENGRKTHGRGGGGRSTEVELVCHDWAGKRRDGGGWD